MIIEPANRYNVVFAFALARIVVTMPNFRDAHQVPAGSVFLSSPETAHAAALKGLCRAIDPATDMDAPVDGDRALFVQHAGKFFELPYNGAQLAVRIEPYKEPAAPRFINAFPGPAPTPPSPQTGFEFPR